MQEFIKKLSDYILLGTPIIQTVQVEILPIIKRLEKFLADQKF
jgi:hypothetical protein